MKKILGMVLSFTIISSAQASSDYIHTYIQNGQQSCEERFPNSAYCYPIHAAASLKQNQVLIIRYTDSPTTFTLLTNQTGFTTANNTIVLNDKIKVSLGTINQFRHVTINKKLYAGDLGINKIGLLCDTDHCINWTR